MKWRSPRRVRSSALAHRYKPRYCEKRNGAAIVKRLRARLCGSNTSYLVPSLLYFGKIPFLDDPSSNDPALRKPLVRRLPQAGNNEESITFFAELKAAQRFTRVCGGLNSVCRVVCLIQVCDAGLFPFFENSKLGCPLVVLVMGDRIPESRNGFFPGVRNDTGGGFKPNGGRSRQVNPRKTGRKLTALVGPPRTLAGGPDGPFRFFAFSPQPGRSKENPFRFASRNRQQIDRCAWGPFEKFE